MKNKLGLVVAYVASLLTLIVLDVVWLGFVMREFFAEQFGPLLKTQADIRFAFLFYILYGLGMMVFVIIPAVKAQSWTVVLRLGALLGFIAYMTFDLTGAALIAGFPLGTVIPDVVWGAAATALAALAGYAVARRFEK